MVLKFFYINNQLAQQVKLKYHKDYTEFGEPGV